MDDREKELRAACARGEPDAESILDDYIEQTTGRRPVRSGSDNVAIGTSALTQTTEGIDNIALFPPNVSML